MIPKTMAQKASRLVKQSLRDACRRTRVPEVYFVSDDLSAARPVVDLISRRLDPCSYTLHELSMRDAESIPWSTDSPLVILWTRDARVPDAKRSSVFLEKATRYLRTGGNLLIRSHGDESIADEIRSSLPLVALKDAVRDAAVSAFEVSDSDHGGKIFLYQSEFSYENEVSRKVITDTLEQLGMRLRTLGTDDEKSERQTEMVDAVETELQWLSRSNVSCPKRNSAWKITPCSRISAGSFSSEKYFSELRTKWLGHSVVYARRLSSTMDVVQDLNLPRGTVVIAEEQTAGKGRGGNRWISPPGCAMLSTTLEFSLDAPVFQRGSLVQHLIAMSMVEGVLALPSCQDLDLRLKWPNDIYLGNKSKIGGVLVKCVVRGRSACFHVGCGLNLTNALPTVSVKSALEDKNLPVSGLSFEKYFARALQELESLLESLSTGGADAVKCICAAYEKRMLMVGEDVQARLDSNRDAPPIRGKIVGIDDYGFIAIVRADNGERIALFPDGNRFDVMHNLIIPK